MLFNRFRPDEAISPQRYVWWETLHFFLHAGILLLLAAMTVSEDDQSRTETQNWIVVLSFADGVVSAFSKFWDIIEMTYAGEGASKWSHSHLVGFVDRLGIQPG
jgi:hypothetical protein